MTSKLLQEKKKRQTNVAWETAASIIFATFFFFPYINSITFFFSGKYGTLPWRLSIRSFVLLVVSRKKKKPSKEIGGDAKITHQFINEYDFMQIDVAKIMVDFGLKTWVLLSNAQSFYMKCEMNHVIGYGFDPILEILCTILKLQKLTTQFSFIL